MTNEQLAELRDPEHKQAGWWEECCAECGAASDVFGWHFCVKNGLRTRSFVQTTKPTTRCTGPDWHADDDACFRDWSPVLLAAGCDIWHHEKRTVVRLGPDEIAVTEWEIVACSTFHQDGEGHYRAAILAAVAWLAEHKPELLREAIARVEDQS